MDVPVDTILSRIRARFIHPASGRTYNIDYNPPKVPFRDDLTGEPLVRRVDDEEDVVRKRLDVYNKEVKELLGWYEQVGGVKIARFQGETSDAIYKDLKTYLQEEWMKQRPIEQGKRGHVETGYRNAADMVI